MAYLDESPQVRADRMELGINERLWYSVDWAERYMQAGSVITSSEWHDPDNELVITAGLTVMDTSYTASIAAVLLEWDIVALPSPLGKTVKIMNTITIDSVEYATAILEIVCVDRTGVPV